MCLVSENDKHLLDEFRNTSYSRLSDVSMPHHSTVADISTPPPRDSVSMLADVSMPHHSTVADISTPPRDSVSMLADVSMPHHSTVANISTPSILQPPPPRRPRKEKCKVKLAKCREELAACKINAWTRFNTGQQYVRPSGNIINTSRLSLQPNLISFNDINATQREKTPTPLHTSTPKGRGKRSKRAPTRYSPSPFARQRRGKK